MSGMSSRWLRLSLGAVLTVSFAAAACDRPSDITSPSSNAIVPQFSQGAGNAFAVGQQGLKQVRVDVSATGSNVCEFGPTGGICAVDGATLYVPAHTVGPHTFFTVDLNVGPYVTVSLGASTGSCWNKRPACSNDVGAHGFKQPVTLTLSTFGATADGMVIAWLSGNGLMAQPTVNNGDGTLTAQLTHFSDYSIGAP